MTEDKKPYRIAGRPSTIFRTIKNKDNPYVMIDRRPIENPVLTYKAKGILTYLMSRPDGWEVNITDLLNHGREKAAAIRTGLKELRAAGHMEYERQRENGRITGWLIKVYELPYPKFASEETPEEAELLDSDFQQVENQQIENRGQVLSTVSNTKITSNKRDMTPPASLPKYIPLDDFGKKTKAPKQKKEKKTDLPPFEYPENVRPYGLLFEELLGRCAASRAEWSFWIHGSPQKNQKGFVDFLKFGITPDELKQAFDEISKKGDIDITRPHTIYGKAENIHRRKKMESTNVPTNSESIADRSVLDKINARRRAPATHQ